MKLRQILKLLNLKLVIESELLSAKKFLAKVTPKNDQEENSVDSVLKTNPWVYRIKDSNGEKIIGSFYEKSCC